MMQPGNLREDICAVRKLGTRRAEVDPCVINKHIEPDLAYACQYLLYHQVRSDERLDENHQIYHFLTRHFLHWFEAMAWLGKVYEILPVLRQLWAFLDVRDTDTKSQTHTDGTQETRSDKLFTLLKDINFFVRDNRHIADQAPLQLYASSLIFAPECSQVKSLFKSCMPRWLDIPPKVADVWQDDSSVFEGHTRNITAMEFSTREEYLATCSEDDGTLRIWEIATGICTMKMPQPEWGQPVDVSFSHDSKHLAAAYVGYRRSQRDRATSVIIYDAKAGNVVDKYDCLKAGLPKYSGIRLAFAPDSSMLFVAILYRDILEVVRIKPGFHSYEQAWCMSTRIKLVDEFMISVSTSLISCYSGETQSIDSWHLHTGDYVSTHSIGHSDVYVWRLIKCRGSDLFYHMSGLIDTSDRAPCSLPSNQKLNTRTGQVDHVTYFEQNSAPHAIAPKTDELALAKHNSGVVHMLSMSQCLKIDKMTPDVFPPRKVIVSQGGETILLQYKNRVVLRNVSGKILFESSEVDLERRPLWGAVFLSDDGSVVVAQLQHGTRVWFINSGKEIGLPSMDVWLYAPAVSRDRTLMAFCSRTARYENDGFIGGRLLVWDLKNHREVVANDRSYIFSFDEDCAHWMFFSEDNQTLHTDRGDFHLETGEWNADNPCNPKTSRTVSMSNHHDDYSWMRIDGEDVLWLPESYRPETLHVPRVCNGKNTVAYECRDGSVVVMRLTDSNDPAIR
jgi:WD40 repeat protein